MGVKSELDKEVQMFNAEPLILVFQDGIHTAGSPLA